MYTKIYSDLFLQREEISRRASSCGSSRQLTSQGTGFSMTSQSRLARDEDELMLDEMWAIDVKEEIGNFEKMKKLDSPDSDDEGK